MRRIDRFKDYKAMGKIVYKLAVAVALFSASVTSHAASDRVALVIGNSAYKHLSPLKNTTNDARLVSETLKSIGFDTQLVLDASERQLKRELRAFSQTSASANIALVFYAGHGAQVAGENFILPVDMEAPTSETDITLQSLKADDLLQAINAKSKVLILDACRDNPALTRSIARARGGGASRGLAAPKNVEPTQNGGIFIAYATEAGNVALDGDGKNSPFTTSLAKHLTKPMSIDDMFSFVTRDVRKATNNTQRPFKYASLDQILCLTKSCPSSSGSVTPPPQNVAKETQAEPSMVNSIASLPSLADAEPLLIETDPHKIYNFLLDNPSHPKHQELFRRMQFLAVMALPDSYPFEVTVKENQIWSVKPKTLKDEGDGLFSIITTTVDAKRFLIFDTSETVFFASVFSCKDKTMAFFANGKLDSTGNIAQISSQIDPKMAVRRPIPPGSLVDSLWMNICTLPGFLTILPSDSLSMDGWQFTMDHPNEGAGYFKTSLARRSASGGIALYRTFYKTPLPNAMFGFSAAQVFNRFRFNCEKRTVSVDWEVRGEDGKIQTRGIAYNQGVDAQIAPGGNAELTFNYACKQ